MARFETRGKRDPTDFRRRASDRRFLVGVVIAAIGLIVLSIALGTALSGTLAKYYDHNHEGPYYLIMGGSAVLVGLLVAVVSPAIRRLMRGVH